MTTRVTQAVLNAPLSAALARHIRDIDLSIEQTRKRIRTDLILVIITLPIIFEGAELLAEAITSDWLKQTMVAGIVWAFFGAVFLIIAVRFSSILKKPRYVLLLVNHSSGDLDSIAATEKRAIEQGARKRLALFLLIFAFPAAFLVNGIIGHVLTGVWPTNLLANDVSLAVMLLSATACFLMGNWILTRSSVAAMTVEEPALHGLLDESVGILPAKARAGEALSVLMDFNIKAASESATSSENDASIAQADSLQPYYEVELDAAGAIVDGEKRCAVFDLPAICESSWNCLFLRSGTQVLHLLLNEVRPAHTRTRQGAFVRRLFTFAHTFSVDGTFTASPDNAVSLVGIVVTAVSVIITLFTAAHVFG